MKKLILFLLPLLLLANVSVKVNKKELTKGEELIITITATGKDIKFPQINNIDGYNVIGTSLVSNIEVINGAMSESLSKSYIIVPDKNLTIPSFSVIIDGKVYKTKPIHIIVKTPKQTKGDYTLDINLSKKNLYLGQSAILDVKLHYKPPVESIQLQKPQIKGFLVQEILKTATDTEAEYKFLITPLKSGEFTIGPLMANIGILVKENPFNDPFFNLSVSSLKYKTIYSNQIKVKVNPIPNDSVYGDFKISLKAKNIINAGEPNTAILKVEGCGDFNDLPDFKLDIPNTTIYASKADTNISIVDNELCGTYTKKFTIIADNDYTIPPLKLKEYNGTLNVISTNPIKVKVIGAKPITTPKPPVTKTSIKPTKQHTENNKNYYEYAIYLILIVLGIGLGYFISKITSKEKKDDIFSKIKKADQKELFNLLIPYSDIPEIKEILQKLEENIYKGTNHKINKKEIIKIIKTKN
ncbi:BatD family protein [Caminibacter pacificus]